MWLNILNNYTIEFGILTEDQFKKVQVNILNTDDSITKIDMDIKDISSFMECYENRSINKAAKTLYLP